ncbi:MAG TPA: glycosyltransferase family 39 protein [Chitinivibrionales bacterium]|nr:glycosyltransferase family 39 protein [Chitinivibrionales bacterium]
MKPAVAALSSTWRKSPLAVIMLLAILFRLFAFVFAKGYGMHDDHFGVIDLAQRWLDGTEHPYGPGQGWLSPLYPWLHFLLFGLLQKFGIFDPQAKMYAVRFFHALYSLLTVYFGYKTVLVVSDENKARLAGLLLAILWPFPFMAVRNLVEFVCVPPLVIGTYLLVKDQSRGRARVLLLSGAFYGLAFAIRFQTLSMAGTIILVLLVRKEIKPAAIFALGLFLSAFCFLGVPDWAGYGAPFISFWNYFFYNKSAAYAYTTGPVYQYFGLTLGVLIPPTSLLLLYGFCRTWKKHALIFWPALAFFLLHSFFPNKQERFILPVLPFIVMGCVIGWQEFAERSRFWSPGRPLMRGLWAWFWFVNTLLLLLATFTYSKKSRVETLSFLSREPGLRAVLIETTDAAAPQMPLFYLGRNQVPLYYVTATAGVDSLRPQIESRGGIMPNRVVFLTKNNLDKRVKRLEPLLPGLSYETTVSPSIADALLYFLNPKHNVNQTSVIYKTGN